jgi:phage tail protein X
MTYTEYITKDGDRLDLICFRAYGDPFGWRSIIDANPALPIQDVFPAGIRLVIPIIEQPSTQTPTALLPPWKRA